MNRQLGKYTWKCILTVTKLSVFLQTHKKKKRVLSIYKGSDRTPQQAAEQRDSILRPLIDRRLQKSTTCCLCDPSVERGRESREKVPLELLQLWMNGNIFLKKGSVRTFSPEAEMKTSFGSALVFSASVRPARSSTKHSYLFVWIRTCCSCLTIYSNNKKHIDVQEKLVQLLRKESFTWKCTIM